MQPIWRLRWIAGGSTNTTKPRVCVPRGGRGEQEQEQEQEQGEEEEEEENREGINDSAPRRNDRANTHNN